MAVKPGEYVKISCGKVIYEGLVLPRPETYPEGYVTLKQDSGYNVGILEEKITNVEVLEREISKKKATALPTQSTTLPKIAIVNCGGTIVSSLDYKTGGVKHLTKPNQLISMVPEIGNLANICAITNPYSKDSGEVESDDWKKLAQTAYDHLIDPEVKGIVIIHGTDSLHYTSAALSFLIKNVNKPVAFAFSQRSVDRSSSDAFMNLESAVRFVVDEHAPHGIYTVGHSSTHDDKCIAIKGTKVRKMHASRRDAFQPINDTPAATIMYRSSKENKVIVHQPHQCTEQPILHNVFEKKVAYIHYTPNLSSDILRFYVKQGYTGIVISMLGLGQIAAEHASNNWIPAIQEAIKEGVIICACAQTIYGQLQPSVYATGRTLQKSGVIYLKDMHPETAFVKLGCALGKWSSQTQVKQYMEMNIAGEYSHHQTIDMYNPEDLTNE